MWRFFLLVLPRQARITVLCRCRWISASSWFHSLSCSAPFMSRPSNWICWILQSHERMPFRLHSDARRELENGHKGSHWAVFASLRSCKTPTLSVCMYVVIPCNVRVGTSRRSCKNCYLLSVLLPFSSEEGYAQSLVSVEGRHINESWYIRRALACQESGMGTKTLC